MSLASTDHVLAPAADPTDPSRDDARLTVHIDSIITAIVVAGAALFVFWQLQPSLILSDTTPTGGDMGAHVWGPAFLRDELLPRLRLTGWTPDWYSGFPAFHFYMVVPALAMVVLDVGLHPALAVVVLAAVAYGLVRLWSTPSARPLARRASVVAAILLPLLVPVPYNIAFKLVAVSGVVLFPVGAWALGHLSGLRFPGPAFLALASLAFAFDRSFNIYGGNIASTMAGEFAASISLTVSLVALGLVLAGTRTGRHRGWAAIAIALTGLCHLLPAFFLLAAIAVIMTVRLAERRWASIGWLAVAGTLSALVSAFWVLPFFVRTDYLNDMGWERIEILHSPLVTRSDLNPADVLSDYPPLPVLLVLAAVGLVLSIIRRIELGWVLAATAVLMAAGFVWFPDGRLWNARILPFYYLCVTLLAGLAVALVVGELARARAAPRYILLVGAVGALLVPAVRDAWVWPEPADDGWYAEGALLYSLRVLATFALVTVGITEAFRFLSRFASPRSVLASLVAVVMLAVSPARDGLGSLTTARGLFWGAVLVGSIAGLLYLVGRALAVAVHALRPKAPDEQAGGTLLPPEDPHTVRRVSPLAGGAVLFVLLGLALDVVGGAGDTDEGRAWSFLGVDVVSDDTSFVPGWARWNFSGLEAKPRNEGATGDVGKGGWEEYQYVQRTMLGVGEQVGCGRSLWEFAPELNRYGTTMAMMLLPMWTDGCIGSMEGLYFEATPTVPYHFLAQSDLSAPSRNVGASESVGGPSRAMRDLPYEDFDIDAGVQRLRELGVRYYLAFSPPTVEAARAHPALTEITTATPWVVFETDARVIEPLAQVPVVIDPVRDHQDQWLDVGVEWFTADSPVRPASTGPDEWARVDGSLVTDRYGAPDTRLAGSIPSDAETLAELLPRVDVGVSTEVSNVELGTDSISFAVDQVGAPILVRTSYFPNWRVAGADGPYRVAPNFMVVVPTENTVELTYGRTLVDWAAIGLTLLGAVGLVAVVRADRRRRERAPQ